MTANELTPHEMTPHEMTSAGDELGIVGIDHVGIAVTNLDEAIAYHVEILGMQLLHRETNVEQLVDEAMLAVGDSVIQLLAPTTEDSPIAKFLTKSGQGLQQLAYRVRDVETTSQILRERGLTLLYPQARRGTSGTKINFIHPKSAHGVLIELVEHPAD